MRTLRWEVSDVTFSGAPHPNVAEILKNKSRMSGAVEGSTSLQAIRLTKLQKAVVPETEKLLAPRIEDQTQEHIPLGTTTIDQGQRKKFVFNV